MFELNAKYLKEVLEKARQEIYEKTNRKVVLYYDISSVKDLSTTIPFMNDVCSVWGMNLGELQGTGRSRKQVTMRQILWLLLKCRYPGISLSQCGRLFNRDHTTVLAGLKDARDLLSIGDDIFLAYYNPVKHFSNAE